MAFKGNRCPSLHIQLVNICVICVHWNFKQHRKITSKPFACKDAIYEINLYGQGALGRCAHAQLHLL